MFKSETLDQLIHLTRLYPVTATASWPAVLVFALLGIWWAHRTMERLYPNSATALGRFADYLWLFLCLSWAVGMVVWCVGMTWLALTQAGFGLGLPRHPVSHTCIHTGFQFVRLVSVGLILLIPLRVSAVPWTTTYDKD